MTPARLIMFVDVYLRSYGSNPPHSFSPHQYLQVPQLSLIFVQQKLIRCVPEVIFTALESSLLSFLLKCLFNFRNWGDCDAVLYYGSNNGNLEMLKVNKW